MAAKAASHLIWNVRTSCSFFRSDPGHAQGFLTILATESSHAYAANWWPPGHIIGYEHGFVHGAVDFLQAVASGEPIAPDFSDGVKCIKVLDSAQRSAASGHRVKVC